jgi:hypothetical protein
MFGGRLGHAAAGRGALLPGERQVVLGGERADLLGPNRDEIERDECEYAVHSGDDCRVVEPMLFGWGANGFLCSLRAGNMQHRATRALYQTSNGSHGCSEQIFSQE